MAKFSKAEVEHIARLSQLRLSGEESERVTEQFNRIVGYIDQLTTIPESKLQAASDLFEIEPLKTTPARADVVRPSLPSSDLVKMTPEHFGPFFLVPKVVE